ncbi:MAG: IS5 family transposase [Bacteroidetes bacterium]|nr:MAG: IS5 family transposase [Bacteroidota bacterium]
MSVLSESIIKSEILPHLSVGKRGKRLEEALMIRIVQLILFRLKSGCQWRELPMKQYLDQSYNWRSVFHHFNKWSKDGSWQRAWIALLAKNKARLDLSSAQLDGSQTPCKRGGGAVGYQSRKASMTSNMLFISDSQGVIVAASQPQAGNHHDVFDIKSRFGELIQMLKDAQIEVEGLFLNADAGFDCTELRSLCHAQGVIPNFAFNARKGSKLDREEHFDERLYQRRTVVEHAFAWLDAFKALLIRFETTARNWFSWNILGFIAIFARKTAKKL